MGRREARFTSRYFLKMMLSYCLVIVIGLVLVSVFTNSWVTARLTEKESAKTCAVIVLSLLWPLYFLAFLQSWQVW